MYNIFDFNSTDDVIDFNFNTDRKLNNIFKILNLADSCLKHFDDHSLNLRNGFYFLNSKTRILYLKKTLSPFKNCGSFVLRKLFFFLKYNQTKKFKFLAFRIFRQTNDKQSHTMYFYDKLNCK